MKTLTVIGRAGKRQDFETTVMRCLSSAFELRAIAQIDEDSEALTFVAYVEGEGNTAAQRRVLRDKLLAVEVHEDARQAITYMNDTYGLEPPWERKGTVSADAINGDEIARFHTLAGLLRIGQVGMVRAELDGVEVSLLVHLVQEVGDETQVLPLAILVDGDLAARLQMFGEENEE